MSLTNENQLVMTSMEDRPARLAGMESGTAILALAICVILTVGIAALSHSAVAAVLASVAFAGGLIVALRILPRNR
ncbi:hypothetical protein [Nocardia mangyaensis]|uniref:hypothetical protein n=1 Tax=Nocardia mangyaensis TaxID=2213200 RepID=UPI002677040C|nr:hypothetical protein [Nocardia mangyaensis]MDO3649758.1 hypothetical protein [Nocardia mangyaensis]